MQVVTDEIDHIRLVINHEDSVPHGRRTLTNSLRLFNPDPKLLEGYFSICRINRAKKMIRVAHAKE